MFDQNNLIDHDKAFKRKSICLTISQSHEKSSNIIIVFLPSKSSLFFTTYLLEA